MTTTTALRMPISSMVKVNDLISTLEQRDLNRQDFMILNPSDHRLRYEQGNKELGISDRMLITFDGQDIEVSESAISSGCKMLKTSSQYFRDNFENWQSKWVKDFSSALQHNGSGCYARTDCLSNGIARRVESFVSGNWELGIGESTIVRGIAERLNAQYGDSILGVQVVSERKRNSLYRFVFGNTIMGDDSHTKMYPMVNLLHSPYGFSNTELSLGIYRVICENGALRRNFSAGTVKWNQRSNPDTFFSRINSSVDMAGDFATECKKYFERMVEERLTNHPLVTLNCLRQARAITTQHLETATMFLPEREVKTEYDMLNILTDSAKNIHPINRRQEAESNAFHVALSSGGFNGLVTSDNLAKINHDRSYN